MKVVKLGADKIVTGADALTYFESQGTDIRRALIVMGKGSLIRNGSLKKLQDALAAAGIESDTFTGVGADPAFSTVMEGAKKARAYEPDAIIGFGGGSAMDAAKVIWIFYENQEHATLESILLPNVIPTLGKRARLICIPTTAGTGSEVTRVAVITEDETHVKRAVVDLKLRMIPSIALLCPEFTVSMPPSITADSGMDAMTHAIESYVCTSANPYSQAMSLGSFKDAYTYLPKACADGENLEYRERMLSASCMAGIAFSNCSLGIAHSIAHTLGGQYGIPHGKACAMALPYVIRYNAQDAATAEKYREMAALAGFASLETAVLEMCGKLNIPTRLRDVLESEEDFRAALPKLAALAAADASTPSNPVPADAAAFAEILGGMYEGTGCTGVSWTSAEAPTGDAAGKCGC